MSVGSNPINDQKSDPLSSKSAQNTPQQDPKAVDFFANLFNLTDVDPGRFIENKDGTFEMVLDQPKPQKKSSGDEHSKHLDSKKEEVAKTTESNAQKDANSIVFEDLITLEALPLERHNAYYAHIYRMAERQLQQTQKSTRPHDIKKFIFQTELWPNEELDIQLQKNKNALNIKLFANGDLHLFLADKLSALKKYLQLKNEDLDDIDIEVIDREQRPSKDTPLTVHQRVQFMVPETHV